MKRTLIILVLALSLVAAAHAQFDPHACLLNGTTIWNRVIGMTNSSSLPSINFALDNDPKNYLVGADTCYANIQCEIDYNGTCTGNQRCVASLTADLQAYISKDNPNETCVVNEDYPYKLCCGDVCSGQNDTRICGGALIPDGLGGFVNTSICEINDSDIAGLNPFGCYECLPDECVYNGGCFPENTVINKTSGDIVWDASNLSEDMIHCSEFNTWCPLTHREYKYDVFTSLCEIPGEKCFNPLPGADKLCSEYKLPIVTSNQITPDAVGDIVDYFVMTQPPNKDCFWREFTFIGVNKACTHQFSWQGMDIYHYTDITYY